MYLIDFNHKPSRVVFVKLNNVLRFTYIAFLIVEQVNLYNMYIFHLPFCLKKKEKT